MQNLFKTLLWYFVMAFEDFLPTTQTAFYEMERIMQEYKIQKAISNIDSITGLNIPDFTAITKISDVGTLPSPVTNIVKEIITAPTKIISSIIPDINVDLTTPALILGGIYLLSRR